MQSSQRNERSTRRAAEAWTHISMFSGLLEPSLRAASVLLHR